MKIRTVEPRLLALAMAAISSCWAPATVFAGLSGSYSTNFSGIETPILEGGSWTNGKTLGLDWADVITLGGLACGTELGLAGYDDSTAILTGVWSPNQSAQAKVHSVNQNDSSYEEVELRLRSTISPHQNTGYEINFRCWTGANRYIQIVRWNGPLGDFTFLNTVTGPGVRDGDTVRATIVGNVITAYVNGVQVIQATDDTYKSGNPGIGFYLLGGSPTWTHDYGFSSFSATDDSGSQPAAPVFTQQPVSKSVVAGRTTAFSAQVNDPAATFQWQLSTNSGGSWSNLGNNGTYSGVTTNSLTVTRPALSFNGYEYRVTATNSSQSVSNAILLTVSPTLADFNADGGADVLWSNAATGDRAFWFMSGTAIGSFGYLAGIPTEWQIVGSDDFDGDGQADILWEDRTTGDRSIWLMNGTAISSFAYLAYVDPAWHIAAVGDFNGDGKTDLVWENTTTGDRAIWYLNGVAIGSFGYLAGIPTEWRIVGAADFNGDGKTDLIWENTATGDRSVWLMNGTAIASFAFVANVDPAWHIAAVADYNGDGKPDLLWENRTTGDRAFWLMDGTTGSGTAYLASVDPSWHIAP